MLIEANIRTGEFAGRGCKFELQLPVNIVEYQKRFGDALCFRWLESAATISAQAKARVALVKPNYRETGFITKYVQANWSPGISRRLSKAQRCERDALALPTDERARLIASLEAMDDEE